MNIFAIIEKEDLFFFSRAMNMKCRVSCCVYYCKRAAKAQIKRDSFDRLTDVRVANKVSVDFNRIHLPGIKLIEKLRRCEASVHALCVDFAAKLQIISFSSLMYALSRVYCTRR